MLGLAPLAKGMILAAAALWGRGYPPVLGDCNRNGVVDSTDIARGTSLDCNTNGQPDECEPDCNHNRVADACDVASGTSMDCDGNGWPDECQPDCNTNGVVDACDVTVGTSADCDSNGTPDECESDCNHNGVADDCDVAAGTSADCDMNGWPDECELDCNGNGIPDNCDLTGGTSADCNRNGWPDECEVDCNCDGVDDALDIAGGTSADCDANGTPDECEPDCNRNGIADACDLPPFRRYNPALGTVPEAQGFTLVSSGTASPPCTLDAGALHQGLTAFNGAQFYRNSSLPLDFTAGFELEAVLQVGSSTYQASCYGFPRAGYAFSATDNALRVFYVWIASDRIVLHNRESDTSTGIVLATTGPYHHFRFVVAGGTATLFVDGTARVAVAVGAAGQASSAYRNTVWFGDGTSCAQSETRLRSLFYRSAPASGAGSADCDFDGTLDECQIAAGTAADCNTNGRPDACELIGSDCDSNGVPDTCQPDCNANGVADVCDLAAGTSVDCDSNGTPDDCQLDCNRNGIADTCDLTGGTSADHNSNGWPDECEVDCNTNGVLDAYDLAGGTSADCDTNGTPDECEPDCNRNGIADACDLPPFRRYNPALGTVPEAQGFTLVSSGTASPPCTLEAGALHQGLTALDGAQFYRNSSLPLDFTARFELEAVLQVNSSTYLASCYGFPRAGYAFSATDDALRVFYVWIASGRVMVHNKESDTSTGAALTMTGPYHHVRFVVAEGAATLFVDGTARVAVAVGAAGEAPPAYRNTVWFGDGTSCTQSETQLGSLFYRSATVLGAGSADCDFDGTPDECQIAAGTAADCNTNGRPDACELIGSDCDSNGVPDICQPDCNADGVADVCDLAAGTSADCDTNGTPDECEPDCNTNGVADACDVAAGTSADCNSDGTPDECEIDCNANGVPDACDLAAGISADCDTNAVPDECDVDCNRNGVPDACDLTAGTSPDCNTNAVPDECDLRTGADADCNTNAIPDRCDLVGGTSVDLDGNGFPDECEMVLFVDAAAGGANNGTSWANAFNDLQAALASVATNGMPNQVWVAAGVYTPAGPGGLRTATFQLRPHVGVFGGFAGTEASLAERAPALHPTALSGDLNGDDGTGGTTAENSYHVVTASGVDATAVLDGFLIIAGNANGTAPHNRGAAIYASSGSATVRHCTFTGHMATYAAVYLAGCSVAFSDCDFADNAATLGGGLYSDGYARPTLIGCTLQGNHASSGGGWFSSGYSTPVLVNCVFVGNSATSNGGGGYVTNSSPTLTNCTFSGNVATVDGGGLYASASGTAALRNCVLWGNHDAGGADESAQIRATAANVNYSLVQGGWTGAGRVGNVAAEPSFVRSPSDGGDGWGVGANDDFGDLHLMPGSPGIDAGDNLADTDHAATGVQALPAADRDGAPRRVDDLTATDTGIGPAPVVDLGAYEFQGDCNANGVPDVTDIAAGTSTDCDSNGRPDECDSDCNRNGVADACEVSAGTAADCNTNGIPDACEVADGTADDCDANGVPDACEGDTDGDGVIDPCDGCPTDSYKSAAGACGCGTPDQDADTDGVPDCVDACPGTLAGEEVDPSGCPYTGACCFALGECFDGSTRSNCSLALGDYRGPESTCADDSDGDGAPDCFEPCPSDPTKTAPGVCGCGVPDTGADADGDTIWDCVDLCPATPVAEPVDAQGCSLYGACCFTTGACFNHTLASACATAGRVFQGHQSFCADGCAFGTAGDFAGDGDVDLADYARFTQCLGGPAHPAGYTPPSRQCRTVFDFDVDNDVDLSDAAEFMLVFPG
jgi:parallel beta-helix repeat protein